MRKPGKQYKQRRVSPQERILQIILVLGLLFLMYQALGYIFSRKSQEPIAQDSTKIVGTLVATINVPRPGIPTSSVSPSAAGASPTSSPLATSSPGGLYRLPAKNYLPDIPAQLGNYSVESEKGMDMSPMRGNAYQAHFTNSYPLYHDSDDAYSVLYTLYVFSDTGSADEFFTAFTMDSLISIYQSTYNQLIYPTPIDRAVENIDAIRMFCFNFSGTLKPEIHCQVMLKDDNLVGQLTIMLIDTGSSATKAITQANSFTDLLVRKLK